MIPRATSACRRAVDDQGIHQTRSCPGKQPRATPASAESLRPARRAVALLLRSGFVGRRSATDDGADPRPREFHPIITRDGFGCEAKPASCSTGKRKFPDPSPVKGLPVRLEPCAPGASPSTSTRAFLSPKEAPACPNIRTPRRRGGGRGQPPRNKAQPFAAVAGHNAGVQGCKRFDGSGHDRILGPLASPIHGE